MPFSLNGGFRGISMNLQGKKDKAKTAVHQMLLSYINTINSPLVAVYTLLYLLLDGWSNVDKVTD